ncbi:hypothetical protein CVT26_005968 [Gymnopilus dilepis]|uniref:Uncharacterized protein n=1 Tax=Gymnopilus dilepis TaxID=231916 RepID=A0A409Y1S8_9AGAR|nr:hypothetical protein CVT26_005968 [Gymnopilus dilepis]
MSESSSPDTRASSIVEDGYPYSPIPYEMVSQATLSGSSANLSFVVKPTEILETTVVRRESEETLKLLALQRLQHKRRSTLLTLSDASSQAEQAYTEKRTQEVEVLACATEHGQSWTSLSPPLAFALASAVEDTTEAELLMYKAKVNECLQTLENLRDLADIAQMKHREAKLQFGTLLPICSPIFLRPTSPSMDPPPNRGRKSTRGRSGAPNAARGNRRASYHRTSQALDASEGAQQAQPPPGIEQAMPSSTRGHRQQPSFNIHELPQPPPPDQASSSTQEIPFQPPLPAQGLTPEQRAFLDFIGFDYLSSDPSHILALLEGLQTHSPVDPHYGQHIAGQASHPSDIDPFYGQHIAGPPAGQGDLQPQPRSSEASQFSDIVPFYGQHIAGPPADQGDLLPQPRSSEASRFSDIVPFYASQFSDIVPFYGQHIAGPPADQGDLLPQPRSSQMSHISGLDNQQQPTQYHRPIAHPQPPSRGPPEIQWHQLRQSQRSPPRQGFQSYPQLALSPHQQPSVGGLQGPQPLPQGSMVNRPTSGHPFDPSPHPPHMRQAPPQRAQSASFPILNPSVSFDSPRRLAPSFASPGHQGRQSAGSRHQFSSEVSEWEIDSSYADQPAYSQPFQSSRPPGTLSSLQVDEPSLIGSRPGRGSRSTVASSASGVGPSHLGHFASASFQRQGTLGGLTRQQPQYDSRSVSQHNEQTLRSTAEDQRPGQRLVQQLQSSGSGWRPLPGIPSSTGCYPSTLSYEDDGAIPPSIPRYRRAGPSPYHRPVRIDQRGTQPRHRLRHPASEFRGGNGSQLSSLTSSNDHRNTLWSQVSNLGERTTTKVKQDISTFFRAIAWALGYFSGSTLHTQPYKFIAKMAIAQADPTSIVANPPSPEVLRERLRSNFTNFFKKAREVIENDFGLRRDPATWEEVNNNAEQFVQFNELLQWLLTPLPSSTRPGHSRRWLLLCVEHIVRAYFCNAKGRLEEPYDMKFTLMTLRYLNALGIAVTWLCLREWKAGDLETLEVSIAEVEQFYTLVLRALLREEGDLRFSSSMLQEWEAWYYRLLGRRWDSRTEQLLHCYPTDLYTFTGLPRGVSEQFISDVQTRTSDLSHAGVRGSAHAASDRDRPRPGPSRPSQIVPRVSYDPDRDPTTWWRHFQSQNPAGAHDSQPIDNEDEDKDNEQSAEPEISTGKGKGKRKASD